MADDLKIARLRKLSEELKRLRDVAASDDEQLLCYLIAMAVDEANALEQSATREGIERRS